MISYRQANDRDFDLTYSIKKLSSKQLVEKIWRWDNEWQLEYHRKQFNPDKIKIIIYDNEETGYISTIVKDDIVFIESILIHPAFQSKGIGTWVLRDIISSAVRQNKTIELQVLRINDRAKRLYERLNFEVFERTDLHYKMRLQLISKK